MVFIAENAVALALAVRIVYNGYFLTYRETRVRALGELLQTIGLILLLIVADFWA